jgi:hypothetical protein
LRAQLDLDNLASLQRCSSLFDIGLERGIRGDVGGGTDGSRVGLALGDLLALENLADLLLDEFVALFAEFEDVGAFNTPL